MLKPIGNSSIDAHRARAQAFEKSRPKPAGMAPIRAVSSIAKDISSGAQELASQGKSAYANVKSGIDKIKRSVRP